VAFEHRELALQQRLAAPRQVAEHVVDTLPQPRLVDRGPDGGLPHSVDRLADLADFVAADPQRRRLGRDVHALAAAQPAHHRGQLLFGQRERGAAERGEPPVDGPAEQDRDEQREDEAGQAEHGDLPHAPLGVDRYLLVGVKHHARGGSASRAGGA
jgi:hypothetical protein